MAVIRPRGNVPRKPLRWTLERAGPEFGLSANSLRKALNRASVEPGEDGCYSTAQLLSGLYGLMHEERLKTQRELTRKYEIANRIAEGSVLDRDALTTGFTQLADALSAAVTSSDLPRQAKETFLQNLASWPLILDGVASRQSKLSRRNGEAPTEDGSES